MNLNEYKTSLSDIGGIQLLESFIKKDSYNTDVPEYLDIMFVEQDMHCTNVYINDCKYKYSRLSDSDFSKLLEYVEEKKYGSALIFLNKIVKPKGTLKEANILVMKLSKFMNDNLYIKENNHRKELVEDWNRDLSRKTYKNAIIKSCSLNENGNVVIGLKSDDKSYLVEYKTNSRLANKVVNSYEYLGPEYSRMILSDLVNVSATYHVTTRFDEADNLGPKQYALLDLTVGDNNTIKARYVDSETGGVYESIAAVDMDIVQEDGLSSIEELIEPFKDEIENMKFEDDLDYAVEQTNTIINDLSAYLKGGFKNRVSLKTKDTTYSITSPITNKVRSDGKVVKGEDGKPLMRQYVPVDLDFNRKSPKRDANGEVVMDNTIVNIDGTYVENYSINIYLLDREGKHWVRKYIMKKNLREILSLEEWYDELIEELPDINPSSMTFDKVYEITSPFVKKLAQDATFEDIKHGDKTLPDEQWKVEEDAGTLQVSDVPAKVDYGDNMEKPKITESNELVLEAWLVDLISRGFEPDSDGYLNRGGRYLIRENDSLILKRYDDLWNMDGSPVDPSVDIVSVLD